MMKNVYLDANMLVYFLDKDSRFHKNTQALFYQAVDKKINLAISPLCLDEFLHVIRKKFLNQKLTIKVVWKNLYRSLKSILTLPNLEIVNPVIDKEKHLDVIRLMQKYNLSPRDGYHLFIILTNNIDAFATFDSDFVKVKEVEMVGLG